MTLHDRALQFVVDYRKINPDFVCYFRKRFAEGKERTWFLGNESYAFIGLTQLNAGNTVTKSLGIVVDAIEDDFAFKFECEYKESLAEKEISMYQKLISNLKQKGYQIDSRNEDTLHNIHFTSFQEAEEFLDKEYHNILDMVESNGFANKLISQDKFQKEYNKIKDMQSNYPKSTGGITNPYPPLNQILYGPPGTGKTYNTINKALEIIGIDQKKNKLTVDIIQSMPRKELKKIFDDYVKEGRIVFTTFHQSMTYEDFVEGIKPTDPNQNDGQVAYDIQDGIFKQICKEARTLRADKSFVKWSDTDYYKMSLGGKNRPDIHQYCIDNNIIALGWGGHEDLSELKNLSNWDDFKLSYTTKFPNLVKESSYNITAAFTFLKMKENDIVVISKGNKSIDAIGIVKGDYYFDETSQIEYSHFRKVEWVATNLDTTPERFFSRNISQQTIYQFYNESIKTEEFQELTATTESKTRKPYVLIIDEINRGNVSEIFGEMITLLEEDKRAGKEHQIATKLAYSKRDFTVPANVYIIGTMNTADRSIEALDTALRRRFSFVEMPPKAELLKIEILRKIGICKDNTINYLSNNNKNENATIVGIDLFDLIEVINYRIEVLLDRDHKIGHSYFLDVIKDKEFKEESDFLLKLKDAFKNKIIPLLQEYFYDDYAKIGMILGSGFVTSKSIDKNLFPKSFREDVGFEFDDSKIYKLETDFEKENVFLKEEFKKAIFTLLNKTDHQEKDRED